MRNLARLLRFSLGILSPTLATIFAGLFIFQYQQPQVVYYSDGNYSKVNDVLVGSIFIVNEGRSSESNLSILINEKFLPNNIAVDYLSAKPEIIFDDKKTRVVIPKLKPREYAEVVFRSSRTSEYFEIENVASESGNIEHREWIKKSWQSFTRLQMKIIGFLTAFMFSMGFMFGSILQKKTKSKRAAS